MEISQDCGVIWRYLHRKGVGLKPIRRFLVAIVKNIPMLQNWFKDLVERHAFGVCQYLGERMHVAPAEVRKYFIYTSFIGMGSPLIVYLFVAFWMNVKRYIRRGRNELYN